MRLSSVAVVPNPLHLTVDDCTLHVYCTYSYNDGWLLMSGSNVTSYVSMQRAITVRQSRKPPQHRLSSLIEGTRSNVVFKLIMLTVETLTCFVVKTA